MSGSRKGVFLPALLLVAGLLFAQGLQAGTVESEVTAFVKQIYRDNEVKVTFSGLPPQAQGDVPVKNIGFSKVPDMGGDGICMVAIESRNGKDASVYVPFRVLVKRSLYITKRNIGKGDVIHLADLSIRESYLNGATANYPVGVDDVVGKGAKKEIAAGAVLTTQVPGVRRGGAKGRGGQRNGGEQEADRPGEGHCPGKR